MKMKSGNIEYTSDAINRKTNTFQMFQSGGQQNVSSYLGSGTYNYNHSSTQLKAYFRDTATQPADPASVLNDDVKDGYTQFPYKDSTYDAVYRVPNSGMYAVSCQIETADGGWASFPDNSSFTRNGYCYTYRIEVRRRTSLSGSVQRNWEGSSDYRNINFQEARDVGGFSNVCFQNYLYAGDFMCFEMLYKVGGTGWVYFNNSGLREPSATGFTKRPASFICIEQIAS